MTSVLFFNILFYIYVLFLLLVGYFTLRDNKVEWNGIGLNRNELNGKPKVACEFVALYSACFTESFKPQPFVKCSKYIKDEEGEVLLVVKQQGEGDKTLVDENGNGSGHI